MCIKRPVRLLTNVVDGCLRQLSRKLKNKCDGFGELYFINTINLMKIVKVYFIKYVLYDISQ